MVVQIKVEGMACPACEKRVQQALLSQSGVKEVTASAQDGLVTVSGDMFERAVLAEEIESLGYEVVD